MHAEPPPVTPTPLPPPTPVPNPGLAPRSVLSPWQRPLVHATVVGSIVLGATGVFLLGTPGGTPAASSAFLAHLLVGVLLVPLLLVFTVPHAIAQTRRKPVIALSGAGVLLLALAVAGTGAMLFLEPTSRPTYSTWAIHVFGGFGLFALYALHRMFGSNPAKGWILGVSWSAVVLLGAALLLWEKADPGRVSFFDSGDAVAAEAAHSIFAPSNVTSGAGRLALTAEDIRDVASCATCHRRITDEWRRSAHRHSSMTNPFYKATILDMRERFPKSDTQWCAGCHDPALLFTSDPKGGPGTQMSSEGLDFDSDDARTGLTCVVCHAIETKNSTLGNADFTLRSRKVYPGEKSSNAAIVKAHDVMLRLKPEAHVASMTPSNIRESSHCSLCHKAEPPPELNRWHWARAQDEYDSHDDSGVSMGNARSFYHPPASKRCQDCHMPMVDDREDPAADEKGMVRSHLFATANTMLPHLRGDEDMIRKISTFLKTSARVDITQVVLSGNRRFVPAPIIKPAVRPGEIVEAHVVIRNTGTGHGFPGGTVDSNEVWVDFEAKVGGQPAFFASGKLDPKTGEVDPSAEFYRAYWMRRDGTRFVSRIASDLYTLIYVKRIGPGTADVVRYRFRVPDGATGALELTATLRYRKFALDVAASVARVLNTKDGTIKNAPIPGPDGSLVIQHQLEEEYLVPGRIFAADLAKLPIVDIAAGTLSLPITAEGTPGAPPAPESLKLQMPDDRDRINDLGIANLLQGEPFAASDLFETVTRVDPKYPDGFVNVGRAAVAKNDWTSARDAFDKAFALKKDYPKTLFFLGLTRMNESGGDFAAAEVLFKKVLESFPRDRESHRRLMRSLYEQGKLTECLEVVDRFNKTIDSEDWETWYWAMRSYQDLGDEPRRLAAQQAHDKYRPDDDATNRRGPFLLADPNLHNLAQPVHVHEAPDSK